MEFQEKLTMLLSIILTLTVYTNYISYRVKQADALKYCVFIKGKIKQPEIIFAGKNCEKLLAENQSAQNKKF